MRTLNPTKAADLSEDRARALALTPVSRETLERLDRLVEVLLLWQKTTNLIAPSTIPRLWSRHVADSLQLLPLVPDARVWVDLGSGGGFPGLPVACALAGVPGATVHLVESNQKKAAYLREAVRVTGAPGIVHAARIEDFVKTPDVMADIVTARALAPLSALLPLVDGMLKTGTKALFLKGQDVDAELTEAAKYWNIDASLVPSVTSPDSRIVVMTGAARKPRQA